MDKKIYFLSACLISLIFTTCSDQPYLWMDQEYSGTIVKSDLYDTSDETYYDRWNVGIGGDWKITVESKDDILLGVNVWSWDGDHLLEQTNTNCLFCSNNTVTIRTYTSGAFYVLIWLNDDEESWINNGYKADYKITLNAD